MGTAVAEQLITTNPCVIRAAGSVATVHKAQPATLEELAIIVEHMPDRLRLAVLIAAWCGLRMGEIFELRRGDVDLRERVIRIRRAVARVPGEPPIVGTPKSAAGVRDVSIPPHLLPEFSRHLAEHVPIVGKSLLFVGRDSGEQLASSTLYRWYYPARAAAGRPDLRWHDLRHTGATLAAAAFFAVESGVPLSVAHGCRPDVDPATVACSEKRFDDLWLAHQLTLLDHALQYAAVARPVFPCHWQGKRAKEPMTRNGHLDATLEPQQLEDWWTRWPKAMIGAPPYDDELVIDIDPRNGGSLEALVAKVGPLPPTLTAWSGRNDGGAHLYFKKPEGRLTSTGLPAGVDLKANGYLILPPSIHPATGQPYRWQDPDAPVADMPTALLALLQPPPPKQFEASRVPCRSFLSRKG